LQEYSTSFHSPSIVRLISSSIPFPLCFFAAAAVNQQWLPYSYRIEDIACDLKVTRAIPNPIYPSLRSIPMTATGRKDMTGRGKGKGNNPQERLRVGEFFAKANSQIVPGIMDGKELLLTHHSVLDRQLPFLSFHGSISWGNSRVRIRELASPICIGTVYECLSESWTSPTSTRDTRLSFFSLPRPLGTSTYQGL